MVREGNNLKAKQIFERILGQYRKRGVLDSSDVIDSWISSKPLDTLMFGLFMMQGTYFMRFCFTKKQANSDKNCSVQDKMAFCKKGPSVTLYVLQIIGINQMG